MNRATGETGEADLEHAEPPQRTALEMINNGVRNAWTDICHQLRHLLEASGGIA